MADYTVAPASIPQEEFLNAEEDIVFYGGAAGGGKSFAALANHLKYIEDKHYKGVVVRRTTPMLMKQGAVWDEAKDLYRLVDPECRIRIKDRKIVFRTGAEVGFDHFERASNTDNWQGSQLSAVVMDELTHFEESQMWYLISRLRSKAKMRPNLRATMNPDPDSWVLKYILWYLYPEGHELAGRPDPERDGKTRWFYRLDNELRWFSTKKEALEENPNAKPLSFKFISATCYDNPYINDNYIANLEGLGRVEKEILLYGNWFARPEANGYAKREWFKEVLTEPAWVDIDYTVRAYDFAGTLKSSDSYYDPDYTASVKMSKLKDGSYFIHDVKRIRIRHGDWVKFILDSAREDGIGCDIVVPIDPNPMAKRASDLMFREVIEAGYFVRQFKASGNKVDRFRPFASMLMNGGVSILKGCGIDYENNVANELTFYYSELERFDGTRKSGVDSHDDMVDATSDAFVALAQRMNMPDISGFAVDSASISSVNYF